MVGKTVNDYLSAYSPKKNQQIIKGVILAGGEGKRYADGEVPKVLQPFDGKPIISHPINSLKELGISDKNIGVLINEEISFSDEIESFISDRYSEISCFNIGCKYEWEKQELKKFGPISKAWAIAKYVSHLYADLDEWGSSDKWEDDILLVLNADSIYPKKSLDIATQVAQKCFKTYSDANARFRDRNNRFSALICGLKTLEKKERRLPTLEELALLPFEIKLNSMLYPFFFINGEVTSFQKAKTDIESAIFAFKAGDLYRAICISGGSGRHVPVSENLNTLEDDLYNIYLPNKQNDYVDIEDAGRAIDVLLEELKKSGFNVAEYKKFNEAMHWENFQDFDDVDEIRQDLTEIFEQRAKKGYLENKLGSGLNFICNQLLTKDSMGGRYRVLSINLNMTYLNLNNLALRDRAKQFLGTLKALSLSDKDLLDDWREYAYATFEPKEILEAIGWGFPINLEFILGNLRLNANSKHSFNMQLKCYLNEEFESAGNLIYNYLICERANEWSEYCKKAEAKNDK